MDICCKSSSKVVNQFKQKDKIYLEELPVMIRYYICNYRMSSNPKYHKISYALKNHKPPKKAQHASMKDVLLRVETYRESHQVVVNPPPKDNQFEIYAP